MARHLPNPAGFSLLTSWSLERKEASVYIVYDVLHVGLWAMGTPGSCEVG
jgi:hypothetical protein